jgi:hypothetical protein
MPILLALVAFYDRVFVQIFAVMIGLSPAAFTYGLQIIRANFFRKRAFPFLP